MWAFVTCTSSACLICADSYAFIPIGQILKCPYTGSAQRAPTSSLVLWSPPVLSLWSRPVWWPMLMAGGEGGSRATPVGRAPAHQVGVTCTRWRVWQKHSTEPSTSLLDKTPGVSGTCRWAPAHLVRIVLCISLPSTYLKLLIFLPAILIQACASSSPAFLMMYSAYKLNKHGSNLDVHQQMNG